MKQFLLTAAGVFAALILFFVGLPLVLVVGLIASSKPAATPARAVLSLDLRQSLPDQAPDNPFAFVTGRKLSVLSVAQGLRDAAADDDVKALLIRLPEGGMAPAAADEIRAAVLAFRAAGKPVIAHSQGLYPSGVPVATYMLGAASGGGFWMQPQASLQATGAASETMFYKRFFDKYGIKADYQQRYQYKTAVNPLLYDDYTPAHREEELGWMGSVYGAEVAAAAADRRMDATALRTALEAGPYIAQDALQRRLIDHVGGVEEAEAQLKASAGDGAQLVDFNTYSARNPARSGGGGEAIAVIGAEGAIVTGTSRNSGFSTSSEVRSDDLQRAFQKAAADASVKAIVFRVSSPGGSDTASEQIGAAVRAAKAAGKPVVVSMGTYAASGGYWISADASEIVAEPTTLTGSIGVFGGKFVLGPALGAVRRRYARPVGGRPLRLRLRLGRTLHPRPDRGGLRLDGPHLSGLRRPRGAGAPPRAGQGRRDRQGPGVDGRAGADAGPGRQARRVSAGGGGGQAPRRRADGPQGRAEVVLRRGLPLRRPVAHLRVSAHGAGGDPNAGAGPAGPRHARRQRSPAAGGFGPGHRAGRRPRLVIALSARSVSSR